MALTHQLIATLNSSTPTSVSNSAMSAAPSAAAVSEASSGRPAKKAKVTKTPTLNEIDFDKVILSSYKAGKEGAAATTVYTPLLDGLKARFDLTPPGSLVFSNWGFETNYKLNPEKKPSFLGGPATANKNEYLGITVELNEVQDGVIKALDSKISAEYFKANPAAKTWHPAVRYNKEGKAVLKVKVQITGVEPTPLKIADEGSFSKGAGWGFLQPWMAKTRNFGPCKAKLVIVASSVWCLGGKAGISFHAAEMMLMSVAAPRPQFESAQEDEEAAMADFEEEDL